MTSASEAPANTPEPTSEPPEAVNLPANFRKYFSLEAEHVAADALDDAADALEGGLGVAGTPGNLYEFRLWLRARARAARAASA